ncbi:heat-inducible transcriptional repressor HrcA [Mycoplasma sp. Ms02]|uniref:heat-inducible transcriptional repressor HrcA n=1 Tax=Mycoplasma sp. Ms02 TaxID=353851 RepID=UPI001C8AE61F|nr:heat-inducible transcriptional repressor HrcA [Mycoplasma sp. Ms02]QZE12199.1 heat-inducible transcriptional repressor HrcA [Mycoplasma sp. Ms02]
MNKLDAKYEVILKYTVKAYIETGQPVSSSLLTKKYNLDMSSAKVRYLLKYLVDNGYLEMGYSSSGRIPTNLGYDYYAQYLSLNSYGQAKKELMRLFRKRSNDIDNTIQEAAELISNITGLTIVTGVDKSDALLKAIQIVPIDQNSATVVLVISTGEVFSKYLEFDKNINLEDLRIAIRLFKERLINSPLSTLPQKAQALKPILADAVHNYEDILQSFIKNIFNFETKLENKIYGKGNIILSENISRQEVSRIIEMIETKSVWEIIESKQKNEDENLKIAVEGSSAFLSKRLTNNTKVKEISVVGSNASDYEMMRASISLLEDLYSDQIVEEEKI